MQWAKPNASTSLCVARMSDPLSLVDMEGKPVMEKK